MNIGELFISLGFDVDDKKLKDFNQNIREAQDGLIKVSAAAAGAVGALTRFVSGQAENAVQLRNASAELGVNARAMQGWAAVVHQVNPSITLQAAGEGYKRFAQTIRQQIELGGGPSGSLAILLGKSWRPGMSEEEIIETIRGNKQNVVKQFGGGEHGTAAFSRFLDDVGLGAGSTKAFDVGSKRYEKLVDEAVVMDKVNTNLGEFADATARLDVAMNKFSTDLAGDFTNVLTPAIRSFANSMFALDKFNTAHPGAGAAEAGVFATAAGWLARKFGVKGLMGKALGAVGFAGEIGGIASMIYGGAEVMTEAEMKWLQGGGGGALGSWLRHRYRTPAGSSNGPTDNNPGNMRAPGATSGFQTFPTAMAGLKAMARQLQLYAGRGKDTLSSIVGTYAPADDGNNVPAYIADLVKQTGFSAEQHLSQNGHIDPHTLATLMHAMIKHEKGKDNYGGDVDRAAGLTMTVTQNIHSTAPLDQTIADVNRGNQASLNTTALQLNNGPHQ